MHDSQVPSYARAVMAALQFAAPWRAGLLELSEADWKKALAFCDRAHLTLLLGLTCREQLPEWVRARIDRNLAGSAQRWGQIKAVYEEAAAAFRAQRLEFVVLKGFSHCPHFASHPGLRHQYDLDLLFREQQVFQARDAAVRLGYQPLPDLNRNPLDHLPAMIRETGWEWRGDYFDPQMPVSLELHYRLWDERTERFGPRGLEQFWERRETRVADEVCFAAFHLADAMAYAALHMLRHLLRGGLRPSHLYELAWFLHHHEDESPLWRDWRELHDDSLRRLQAICFSLAHRWYGCRMPPAALEEIGRLPPDVTRWLEMHSTSPLAGMFHPNKDELWLHWSLLKSRRDRIAVVWRSVSPLRLPDPMATPRVPGQPFTWRIRLHRRWRWMVHAGSRVIHHVRTVLPTARSALRWFHPRRDPASTR
jgi:hypothetical protein